MKQDSQDDNLRPDYDFSGAVQGKHHQAYHAGSNVVLLEPDVARIFSDSNAVNTALRMLIKLADEQVRDHLPKQPS